MHGLIRYIQHISVSNVSYNTSSYNDFMWLQVINTEEKIVEVTPRDPCAGVEPVGGHIGSGHGHHHTGTGSGLTGSHGGTGTGGRTGGY